LPIADGLLYRHKWSPVRLSAAGQGKFAGQRPTFYHSATPNGRKFICGHANSYVAKFYRVPLGGAAGNMHGLIVVKWVR